MTQQTKTTNYISLVATAYNWRDYQQLKAYRWLVLRQHHHEYVVAFFNSLNGGYYGAHYCSNIDDAKAYYDTQAKHASK